MKKFALDKMDAGILIGSGVCSTLHLLGLAVIDNWMDVVLTVPVTALVLAVGNRVFGTYSGD